MEFGAPIRELFALEAGAAFLNHGSYGATPRVVLEAQTGWRERLERQPVRFFSRDLEGLLDAALQELATFLRVQARDLVFVDNATTGVNAVLRSVPLQPGDEVLTTDHVHPAVRRALEHLTAVVGARLVVAAVERALTPRTRLALLDHITSFTALIYPVEELIGLCHARGVPVLLDGAHVPGMLDVNVEALGADWFTGNCHKWLFAPKGCAFLWTSPAHQSTLHPPVVSIFHGEGLHREFGWTGTRDPSAWLSVTTALEFLRELGPRQVRTHNHGLALAGARTLAAAWERELPAPDSMFGSMVPLLLPGEISPTQEAGDALNDRLWRRHHIEAPVYPFKERMWLRISAQVYNDPSQYAALAGAVLEELETA